MENEEYFSEATPPTDQSAPQIEKTKLVDANGLLEALFDENSRPSLRWLRQMQASRKIPYIKIGHLVRFDVEKVRQALFKDNLVSTR